MTTQTVDLFAVSVAIDGQRSLHGPVRKDVADRFAAGARAAGATCDVLPLTLNDDFAVAASGAWPPRGFRPEEVASIYVEPRERFVVSLIQGYDPNDTDVTTPTEAVEAAVQDVQLNDPTWFVYDRQTGAMAPITQPTEPNPVPGGQVTLSGRALEAVRLVIDLEVLSPPESRMLDPRTWQHNEYGDRDAYERHSAVLEEARRRMHQPRNRSQAPTEIALDSRLQQDLKELLDYVQPDEEHDAHINATDGHIVHRIRRLRAALEATDPGVRR